MRAQIITGEILVQGTIDASIQSDCVRCLSKTTQELHLSELVFLYEYTGQDFIDLSPGVRDELLLALPMRLLCSEDCKGLCPHCQKNWNKGDCNCVEKNEEIHPFEKLKF